MKDPSFYFSFTLLLINFLLGSYKKAVAKNEPYGNLPFRNLAPQCRFVSQFPLSKQSNWKENKTLKTSMSLKKNSCFLGERNSTVAKQTSNKKPSIISLFLLCTNQSYPWLSYHGSVLCITHHTTPNKCATHLVLLHIAYFGERSWKRQNSPLNRKSDFFLPCMLLQL